jgi:hypothetical protein
MVWIYYKFARVEQNCGKQRQLKQLPDEMWKRKPMSGGAGTYPVSAKPITRCMEPQTVRTSELDRWVVGVTLLLQKWRAKLAATKAKSRGASFEESFGGTGKTDWVSFMIKLLRAYGGCLGARRR